MNLLLVLSQQKMSVAVLYLYSLKCSVMVRCLPPLRLGRETCLLPAAPEPTAAKIGTNWWVKPDSVASINFQWTEPGPGVWPQQSGVSELASDCWWVDQFLIWLDAGSRVSQHLC